MINTSSETDTEFLLNKRLVTLRKESGYTQKQVADVLGVDVTTYAHYESGKRSPDSKKLRVLANLYNQTDELLGVNFPLSSQVSFTEEEFSNYVKKINSFRPCETSSFKELLNMADEMRTAYKPIQNRFDEAFKFPQISAEKLQFLAGRTVKKVHITPQAQYLEQRYMQIQDDILDRLNNWVKK